jgi:hypothetical protein
MSFGLKPIIFHTVLQAGMGALGAHFYNGHTPVAERILGESPHPIPLLRGAIFGASSALFFHATYGILTKLDPIQELEHDVEERKKVIRFASIVFLAILAASRLTSSCGSPLSLKTCLHLSAATVAATVELTLTTIVLGVIVVSCILLIVTIFKRVRDVIER